MPPAQQNLRPSWEQAERAFGEQLPLTANVQTRTQNVPSEISLLVSGCRHSAGYSYSSVIVVIRGICVLDGFG